MAVNTIDYPSIGDREARGDDVRTRTPPSSHAGWEPAADRPDPVALLEEQDRARDYEEFVKAIHSGRLEAREGV